MAIPVHITRFDQATGRPILSREEIWTIADAVIDQHFPYLRKQPTAFPMHAFIPILKREEEIAFELAEIPQLGGFEVCGYTDFDERKIVINLALFSERERSVRFIFAHEIGHWLLHRHCPLALGNASEYARRIYDDESTEFRHRQEHGMTTPREWVEWQANCFASALLLPKEACSQAISDIQSTIYPVSRNHGVIYLNKSELGQHDVKTQIRAIANQFMVSEMTVRFRLLDLQLLVIQDGAEFDYER